MKIGLLGVTYHSTNKGCEALAYSILEILNKVAAKRKERITVRIFMNFSVKNFIKSGFRYKKIAQQACPEFVYDNLDIGVCLYLTVYGKCFLGTGVKTCDCVFDFTAGDSFTDMYGKERFFKRTAIKRQIIDANIPLILGSQTIGPFNDKEVKKKAIDIINDCKEIFARDEISYQYTKDISGRIPVLTTDIAFLLPFTKEKLGSSKRKIGVNPSGLLWSGGYTKDNQFNLKADYKQYCLEIIGKILEDERNEVYLIPHVATEKKNWADNDMVAIEEIQKQYPKVVVAKSFKTAMEAKSYISAMDFFIGARMHATIAALSSGVPMIAVSYSRKFEGLYGSLEYPFVLKLKDLETKEAVQQTMEWFSMSDEIEKYVQKSQDIIHQKTEFLINETDRVLKTI